MVISKGLKNTTLAGTTFLLFIVATMILFGSEPFRYLALGSMAGLIGNMVPAIKYLRSQTKRIDDDAGNINSASNAKQRSANLVWICIQSIDGILVGFAIALVAGSLFDPTDYADFLGGLGYQLTVYAIIFALTLAHTYLVIRRGKRTTVAAAR